MASLQPGRLVQILQVTLLCLACFEPSAAVTCREVSNVNPECIMDGVVSVDLSYCYLTFYIYEDCSVGTQIFDLSGTDITTPGYGDYAVDGSSVVFIDHDGEYDAEMFGAIGYHPLIFAGGGYSEMDAQAYIVDVNEFPPELVGVSPRETRNVTENDASNLVLVEFGVTDRDRDEEDTIKYSTNFALYGNLFELEETGNCNNNDTCPYQLNIARPLDYEECSYYQLEMIFTSSDIRGNTSSVSYTIDLYVDDVDDEIDTPLSWVKLVPYQTLEEKQPAGTEVYTVEATDGTAGGNGRIVYDIIKGNEEQLFAVDAATGVVSTTRNIIDRETLIVPFLSIEIRATEVYDAGHPQPKVNGITQVTNVTILDVNDNVPQFSQRSVELTMLELTDADYTFVSGIIVNDIDQDFGSYNLTTSDPFHLAVTPAGGFGETLVALTAKYVDGYNIFDYETAPPDKTLSFTVVASEPGYPHHTTICTVSIKLLDVDEGAPVLSQGSYKDNTMHEASHAAPLAPLVEAAATADDNEAAVDEYAPALSQGSYKDNLMHEAPHAAPLAPLVEAAATADDNEAAVDSSH